MDRRLLVLSLATVLAAATSPAAAQSRSSYVEYERNMADLGAWDAVVNGRDLSGRPFTARAVEINTVGCGGACVATTVHGPLRMTPTGGTTRAWWEAGGAGPATGMATPFYQTGMMQVPTVTGEYLLEPQHLETASTVPLAASPIAGVPLSRVSFEYPGEDRRIVTLYRTDNKGRETVHARIVYTRRK